MGESTQGDSLIPQRVTIPAQAFDRWLTHPCSPSSAPPAPSPAPSLQPASPLACLLPAGLHQVPQRPSLSGSATDLSSRGQDRSPRGRTESAPPSSRAGLVVCALLPSSETQHCSRCAASEHRTVISRVIILAQNLILILRLSPGQPRRFSSPPNTDLSAGAGAALGQRASRALSRRRGRRGRTGQPDGCRPRLSWTDQHRSV